MGFRREETVKTDGYEFKLIRTQRRSIGFKIDMDKNELSVFAPLFANKKSIFEAIGRKKKWIDRHLAEAQKREAEPVIPLTREELAFLKTNAKAFFAERVKYYEPIVGVHANRITIRAQKSKWGSCSTKGNLNFNCLLMLAPEAVRNYIVVHELCHLKVMDHSKRFYAEVAKAFPAYKEKRRWLKENGGLLMKRLAATEK
ncbi:MAG: M48 family metallopeptidase [Clostridia bacterium]|nr:M48 family metallopeptidase [Clostridia bacterium]